MPFCGAHDPGLARPGSVHTGRAVRGVGYCALRHRSDRPPDQSLARTSPWATVAETIYLRPAHVIAPCGRGGAGANRVQQQGDEKAAEGDLSSGELVERAGVQGVEPGQDTGERSGEGQGPPQTRRRPHGEHRRLSASR
ncbi:hypothetical protein GZL_07898 [Streptomyces sp. 769]|nr:hypothetical protein GZL_07898 [Streptomyces sp. 769]